MKKIEISEGLFYLPGYFNLEDQDNLVDRVRDIVATSPLFVPRMPRTGKPMSVRMTNCGPLGWVTDKEQGYRYQSFHPKTKNPWPEIPKILLNLWEAVADYPNLPQACLINYYEPDAKMGLHQDKDEKNFDAPVLSVSLGDSCLFRHGGEKRKDKTKSFRLNSGDVMLLSGKSRLAFHGVDRIYPGTSQLLKKQGRINLTLRRVSI